MSIIDLPLREENIFSTYSFVNINGSSVDELVEKGIQHILSTAERIVSRAGLARQSYGVNYILKNPRNRLHNLRKESKKYLCREFIAYFNGSLKAEDGLAKASKFWMTLVDDQGNINSNYGYYVFYEPIHEYKNQYNWVIDVLLKNKDSRRAVININQSYHKSDTKDFPCTLGMLFFIKKNKLYCETISRSTDVITGLPYDMGFFSFIHELVWRNLVEEGMEDLNLGETIMKTTFTQIYDTSLNKVSELIENVRALKESELMPPIFSARKTLDDILNGTKKTDVLKWIHESAA